VSDTSRPRVVTISSLYGTGDLEIGRRVAEDLGVEFVDREIPAFVAGQLGLSDTAVAAYDQQPRGTFERLVESLARAPAPSHASPPERLEVDQRAFKEEVERLLARMAASGGVILGRAGAVVLRTVPGALHVRIVGSRAARIRRVMALEDIDEKTAERLLRENDRARAEYGRKLYGVDPSEVDLYHLVIDDTAFEIDTCIELIVAASDARARETTAASQR
jgi:cytidylate kinase